MRSATSVFLAATFILAMLFSAASANASPKDAKPDPVGELKSTIKSGTALLKEKKFKEFIELFMPPDELESLNKSGHLNDVLDSMSKQSDKVDGIVKVFEALVDQDPKLSEDNSIATFEMPKIENAPPDKEIEFQKIKDRWYAKTKKRPAPK